jgi:hypothetical protein
MPVAVTATACGTQVTRLTHGPIAATSGSCPRGLRSGAPPVTVRVGNDLVNKGLTGQPPPEQLSIAHLLLWTSTSAVLLGMQRAMTSVGQPGGVLSDVITFFYAPIFGAGLAACLLAGWRMARGGPQFPREPGHWLLVVGGMNAVVSLSFQLLMTLAMFQASCKR